MVSASRLYATSKAAIREEIERAIDKAKRTAWDKWWRRQFYRAPYWNIIRYDSGPGDLSSCESYEEFRKLLFVCLKAS